MFCPLFDLPIINRNIYDLPGIMYQMDHGRQGIKQILFKQSYKKQRNILIKENIHD